MSDEDPRRFRSESARRSAGLVGVAVGVDGRVEVGPDADETTEVVIVKPAEEQFA
ncbi:hypothetical protein ITP53_10740 [Nonomuraea sp. K274]|uniref:Uncharacterized protein n=1 Tax=Nonomuraea cypriaca TaxID=1187855 RepID=A0A931EXG4_9ACTN|nr:hypothetical protein [Nonomuraea cypriaca]MBF8186215.1 hypothetical protein [Nonomuraea cypriaca]